MNLHNNQALFSDLIAGAAQEVKLPEVYVEKDYWVTQVLKNLAYSNYVESVVFKGGTSLSKAYGLIHRFSEDVDLAVLREGLSNNQCRRLIEKVQRTVTKDLPEIECDPRASKNSSFRKTVHQYPRCIDGDNFGQASPELIVEVNSFTKPEPYAKKTIQSFIGIALDKADRQDLIDEFGLEPFDINVLSVERTLVEKLLGVVKDSYHEDPVSRLTIRIRHLYDICLILRVGDHDQFLQSVAFQETCTKCIEDEMTGQYENAVYLREPLIKAPIFMGFPEWKGSLEGTYNGAFSELVYGQLPTIDEIGQTLDRIRVQVARF
ncbi:nucleotidyl transferase AbiEii/AbiGii toxin family protein [Cellvibrio sp. QJXJ]|uniref:nucleotidyl transferase AbiEii/AbiGii toxin family protein n=1 Tax=Cellvibrio sp. QJXJ TaxID=2964606 RepID=UPI0021C2CE48|nr:nucleotidyl transferase AbiEii/AbiGii toxin family protein [Cellvibrio sp. QJXJ]UUA74259.1 nucleotidyl transferase AbiEii/AbiGii toxin family protein [Cellvibrio sp. QJXJ]